MRALVVAIHGIDSSNQSSFVNDFEDYCALADSDLQVITQEYWAGPFPLINNWIKDGRIASDIFNRVLKTKGTRPVYLVAHSNGTVIALRLCKMLADFGIRVAGIILVAGAVDADVNRNGVLAMIKSQKLGYGAAYCSRLDEVVRGDPSVDKNWWGKLKDRAWGALMWPYGSLGVTGWLNGENSIDVMPGLLTRWFNVSHSGYFEGAQKDVTFNLILTEIHAQ